MAVNPKTLIAHLWMILVGDHHPDDCQCDVCRYRADTTMQDAVARQRTSASVAFNNLRQDLAQFIHKDNAESEIASDEAAYWVQWMQDHFEGCVPSPMVLHSQLDGLPESRLYEVLLGQAMDFCPSLNLSTEEMSSIWESLSLAEDDPRAQQDLLFSVAAMQNASAEI